MRALRLALLAAAALLAATPAIAAPHSTSGLFGTVRRGPTQPVCRAGEPCDAPAHVTLVFSRAGRVSARVRTREDGRYRVALAPGRYAVRTTSRSVFERRPQPATVTVPRGRFARVNFRTDTGIR